MKIYRIKTLISFFFPGKINKINKSHRKSRKIHQKSKSGIEKKKEVRSERNRDKVDEKSERVCRDERRRHVLAGACHCLSSAASRRKVLSRLKDEVISVSTPTKKRLSARNGTERGMRKEWQTFHGDVIGGRIQMTWRGSEDFQPIQQNSESRIQNPTRITTSRILKNPESEGLSNVCV